MPVSSYLDFIPTHLKEAASLTPESTWWQWRGHRIHIARAVNPSASARLLIIHGVGGHSGALWPIASLLAGKGMGVSALDLPLYGLTTCPEPANVR